MLKSTLVWSEQALDGCLRAPAAFVQGSAMRFCGLPDARARSHLIDDLRAVSEGKAGAGVVMAAMGVAIVTGKLTQLSYWLLERFLLLGQIG